MVCVDDDELVDRCLLLRRWGRRSEVQLFGSKKGRRTGSSHRWRRWLEYDNLFIFDEVGWNFEPSELSAAFGLVQLEKLRDNLEARKRNFARLSEYFGQGLDVFTLPRTTPELKHGLAHVPGPDTPRIRYSAFGVPATHGIQRY